MPIQRFQRGDPRVRPVEVRTPVDALRVCFPGRGVEDSQRFLGAAGGDHTLGDGCGVAWVPALLRGMEAEVLIRIALGVRDGEQRLASRPAIGVALPQPPLEMRQPGGSEAGRERRNDRQASAGRVNQRAESIFGERLRIGPGDAGQLSKLPDRVLVEPGVEAAAVQERNGRPDQQSSIASAGFSGATALMMTW